MATIRDQVYTYCEENKRLFSNLTKNQIAKRVSKDLGVSHNTASSYVNDYYKNFYEDTKVDNSLSDATLNSMKEAFEKVGIVSEEPKEETKEDIKEETKEEVKEERERAIIATDDRTTLNVGFMSGTNYMGRFELTAYKVIQYVPQGKDENGNRKESAKLFFENEDDLDTFYRDMKKLFQLQKIIKGDE